MEPVSKKLKVEDDSSASAPKPFTQKGSHDDEVTLDFGEEKLYVPQIFLCLASPVFEAMFRNEFREKKEKRVAMTWKSYENFLDFLMCIHPRYQKAVHELNVLRIVPLAEEYQVTAMVTKCKAAMKWMLSKAEETAKGGAFIIELQLQPLKKCFTVLHSAVSLNYTDISVLAVNYIAQFGYCLYNDTDYSKNDVFRNNTLDGKINNVTTYGEVRKECQALFKSLPDDIRCKILSERLKKVNNNDFKY
ncbi:uncharacterized protein LOC132734088 [Ruditapes philippinarum]|uniref:uncharacterized protein LOC132734088 n=1 Tax=Ruditapes philippinarum TaxID=129788 RepID=UPI00295A9FB8|nr:uncharacterized protein LOC132734088 [Ruditapes philippinarum]